MPVACSLAGKVQGGQRNMDVFLLYIFGAKLQKELPLKNNFLSV